jgi:hypothetical protein
LRLCLDSCSQQFEAPEDLLTPNIIFCCIVCIDIDENKKKRSEIPLVEVVCHAQQTAV